MNCMDEGSSTNVLSLNNDQIKDHLLEVLHEAALEVKAGMDYNSVPNNNREDNNEGDNNSAVTIAAVQPPYNFE